MTVARPRVQWWKRTVKVGGGEEGVGEERKKDRRRKKHCRESIYVQSKRTLAFSRKGYLGCCVFVLNLFAGEIHSICQDRLTALKKMDTRLLCAVVAAALVVLCLYCCGGVVVV